MRYLQRLANLILLITLASSSTLAQDDSTELIFIVENMPLFENEDPSISFRKYIRNYIKEIDNDIPDSISGRIIIQFNVDSTGYVIDPTIIQGLSKEFDSMACQMVLNSPKWSPGTQRGKPVIVRFTFPVYINMDPPVQNQDLKNKKKRKRISKRKE